MRYSELTTDQKLSYGNVIDGNPQDPDDFVRAEMVGCVVEYQLRGYPNDDWSPKSKNKWNFDDYIYRLKPLDKELRKFTLAIQDGAVVSGIPGHRSVIPNNGWNINPFQPVEFVRVIEDISE